LHDAPTSFSILARRGCPYPPKLLVFLRWVPSVVAGFVFGAGGEWRGTDVVVTTIGGDREVLRLVGKDVSEANDALQLLRADLGRLSQEEFLREWGAAEESDGRGRSRS
jgi:hypothetical protein